MWIFENIGKKIQQMATIFFWIGTIGCSILALIIAGSVRGGSATLVIRGLISSVLLLLAAWAASFLMFGFGKLVETNEILANEARNDEKE